jgi:hypothetical protein
MNAEDGMVMFGVGGSGQGLDIPFISKLGFTIVAIA